MKLYIKQRIFSIRDKYDIYDENQRTRFYVESELFSFMAKIHLYDHLGNEQFFIKQKFKFLLSEYEIYKNNILCAKINQRLSFIKGKLDIGSNYGQFYIEGNFLGMEYTIYHNGNYYGSISKKWLSWGDSYELDIAKDEDAAFICALVVAIDHCMHNQNSRNNN
ncbi:MAG TPA: hypothetical protein GXZ90_00020 [Clostridiales bacterium]|nr:hypothetical protein [Clostridiales bacterium]